MIGANIPSPTASKTAELFRREGRGLPLLVFVAGGAGNEILKRESSPEKK
jgi:hypothetical protein